MTKYDPDGGESGLYVGKGDEIFASSVVLSPCRVKTHTYTELHTHTHTGTPTHTGICKHTNMHMSVSGSDPFNARMDECVHLQSLQITMSASPKVKLKPKTWQQSKQQGQSAHSAGTT